jgi:hypothetical protein
MATPLQRDRLAKARVLIVGDAMLDRYWFGAVDRISPEAPVPVVDIKAARDSLGGAGNVARNLRALGAAVNNERRRSGRGSTDFGNVSRRVPGIEARIAITNNLDVPGHSVEFREAAGSEQGRQAMLLAAKSLAMTAVDLLWGEAEVAREVIAREPAPMTRAEYLAFQRTLARTEQFGEDPGEVPA